MSASGSGGKKSSPQKGESLLSNPFQDDQDEELETSEELSTAQLLRSQSGAPRFRYSRRNTTTSIPDHSVTAKCSSISSQDAYMQGLIQQMQNLAKSSVFSSIEEQADSRASRSSPSSRSPSITLQSDNAIVHASTTWDRAVLLPRLHKYHPMDDFMVYLLRRNRIHARNVRVIQDNPPGHAKERSGAIPGEGERSDSRNLPSEKKAAVTLSPTSLTARDESDSASSLDVSGIAECLNRRWGHKNRMLSSSVEENTTIDAPSSAASSNTANVPEESFASLEGSKQPLETTEEVESPNCVIAEALDDKADASVGNETKSSSGSGGGRRGNRKGPSSKLSRHCFVLDEAS